MSSCPHHRISSGLAGHGLAILAAAFFLTAATSADGQAPAEPSARANSQGMKFAAVPGTTVMFAIWETRVSDYAAFVKDASYAWSYKPHFNQGDDHPVVGVSLQDALSFCAWLTNRERLSGQITTNQSYRLPSNEEWDAAIALVRARKSETTLDEKMQDERIFPWGLQWPPPPKSGNYAQREIPGYEDGFEYTSPAGSFPPTKEGLFDLGGNVWEWTWDRQVQALPVGTLRGGSWAYFRQECLASAYKYEVPSKLQAPTIGFRCVFEDRQRTASLLAAQGAKQVEEAQQRKAEMEKNAIDPKEVAAMQKRLRESASASPPPAPDAAALKPAEKNSPHTNSLGMELSPVPGLPLLVGRHEVRVRDYEAFVKASGRSWDRKPPYITSASQPASGVSWEGAQDFCDWLTARERAAKLIPDTAKYRLPTDAEWSQLTGMPAESGADPSARHQGNKLHFPWGNDAWPPPAGSVNIDSTKAPPYHDTHSYTAPAGSFTANAAGLHDLGGNVSEWTADAWPGAADDRVIRGGSYLSFERDSLLSSARLHLPKTSAPLHIGFRCVIEF